MNKKTVFLLFLALAVLFALVPVAARLAGSGSSASVSPVVTICGHAYTAAGICAKCNEECRHDNMTAGYYVGPEGHGGCSVCMDCDYRTADIDSLTPHTYADGACETCGYACPHDYLPNGSCTVCGIQCTHTYVDGTCTVCGAVLTETLLSAEINTFAASDTIYFAEGITWREFLAENSSTFNGGIYLHEEGNSVKFRDALYPGDYYGYLYLDEAAVTLDDTILPNVTYGGVMT